MWHARGHRQAHGHIGLSSREKLSLDMVPLLGGPVTLVPGVLGVLLSVLEVVLQRHVLILETLVGRLEAGNLSCISSHRSHCISQFRVGIILLCLQSWQALILLAWSGLHDDLGYHSFSSYAPIFPHLSQITFWSPLKVVWCVVKHWVERSPRQGFVRFGSNSRRG